MKTTINKNDVETRKDLQVISYGDKIGQKKIKSDTISADGFIKKAKEWVKENNDK